MPNLKEEILKEFNEECLGWCISFLEHEDVSAFRKHINFWLSSKLDEIEKEVCICAAVKAEDGSIYRGHRHGQAMQACRDAGKELWNGVEQQGFITSRNRYVLRDEGRILQDEAGIKSADSESYRGKTLFSEDLY